MSELYVFLVRCSKMYKTTTYYMLTQACKPSVAQGTHSYFRRLPALERFYRGTKYSLLKSTYSIWNLKTKLKNIPVVLPRTPIKI